MVILHCNGILSSVPFLLWQSPCISYMLFYIVPISPWQIMAMLQVKLLCYAEHKVNWGKEGKKWVKARKAIGLRSIHTLFKEVARRGGAMWNMWILFLQVYIHQFFKSPFGGSSHKMFCNVLFSFFRQLSFHSIGIIKVDILSHLVSKWRVHPSENIGVHHSINRDGLINIF